MLLSLIQSNLLEIHLVCHPDVRQDRIDAGSGAEWQRRVSYLYGHDHSPPEIVL